MFEHIKYKESKIKNGLTILTAENNHIPIVDIQIWTRTGYRYEKPDELGYAHLLEHMLLNGTERRPTTYDIQLEIQGKGGYFNAYTNQESVRYVIEMMSQDAENGCEILSDMFLNSLLKPDALENEKKVVLQELKQNQENNDRYTLQLAQKKLFSNHPLSNNILGTEETTNNATSEKLRNYLASHYRPDQSALVVSGDMPHKRVVKLAEKYFGAWQNPAVTFDPCLKPITKAPKNYYFEKRDTKQTFISLNYYCPTLTDMPNLEKLAALIILEIYLGSGPISALYRELRENHGLVYNVGSWSEIHKDAGILTIKTSTQKPQETVKVIEQVIKDIPDNLTDDLFERVKKQTIANFTLYFVKPNNQSNALGGNFVQYNRLLHPDEWIGYLKSAKRKDAIAFANRYLKPENSVLVVLGPYDIGR